MSREPTEVFVIYDAGRDSASVTFEWEDLAAETGVVARTGQGVQAEFSVTDPVRLLALTVSRPVFGRDAAFVRHLYTLLGSSVVARLLMADAAGTTSAAPVPVPPAEVEELLARWERLAPPCPGLTAMERPVGERSPDPGRTVGDVVDLARQRLIEWFVPVVLYPVVARRAPGAEEDSSYGKPVAFHGRVTLREDLARIGGVHPVARADVLDGRLMLRAKATGTTPSGTLMISPLGSEPTELALVPGGDEFRVEVALSTPPGPASFADDYALVLSVGLRAEGTSGDE